MAVAAANGAGKSTLINAVSRLVTANSGAILFEGENIVKLGPADAVARGIVQSPEGRQLFAPLTVRENLQLGFHRLAGSRDRAAFFVSGWTTSIRCSRSSLSAPCNARGA